MNPARFLARHQGPESPEGFATSTPGKTVWASPTMLQATTRQFVQYSLTSGGQISRNGHVDPVTNNVVALVYHNHTFFQENTTPTWYYWNTTTSDGTPGTPGWVTFNLLGPISLSATTYASGAVAGTVIATVSVPMTTNAAGDTFPGSFGGTLTLGGTDAASFAISGTTLSVAPGHTLTNASYSITITAQVPVGSFNVGNQLGPTTFGLTPSGVLLSNASELNPQVQAQPAGTVFSFTNGAVYRLTTPIIPKTNMQFVGNAANPPVLNGSVVISSFTNASGVFHASLTGFSQSPNLVGTGNCLSGRRCDLPYDVYVNNVLYANLTSNTVTAGTNQSYIDLTTNPPTLYIGQNPAGLTVEVTFAASCFDAKNAAAGNTVTISNLIVEKFAVVAQSGAVGSGSDILTGTGWQVSNVEARFNHGQGIRVGNSWNCTGCHLHHNGQMGYSGGGSATVQGTSGVLNNSEVDHNNTAGFNSGWEAGGGKFANSTSYTVSNCNVHDNIDGPGIWWDINNYLTTTTGNTCTNNDGPGIMYEISYDGTISSNTCTNNAALRLTQNGQFGWGGGIGQIFLSTSQNVTVNNNTVKGGGASWPHGILMIQQNRGTGNRGAWAATNNNIHDNSVTIDGSTMFAFFYGADFNPNTVQATTTIQNNHYHLISTTYSAFDWNGAFANFATWQGATYSFDTTGTVDTVQ